VNAPPNAPLRTRKFSGERLKKNGVRREQPARVAQVLPSLRALASPLYSVWNTLSRATLNAFALVLVLPFVNLLSHFCPSTEKKDAAPPSTPDLKLAAQTRCCEHEADQREQRGARCCLQGTRQRHVRHFGTERQHKPSSGATSSPRAASCRSP
jgi:hypothetical protein